MSAFVSPGTLVDVLFAVGTSPSRAAVTAVAGDVIVAGAAILTWIRLAFVDVYLASLTHVAIKTIALERSISIGTCAVDAIMLLGETFINVCLTVDTLPANDAATRVASVSINTGCAIDAQITGYAIVNGFDVDAGIIAIPHIWNANLGFVVARMMM